MSLKITKRKRTYIAFNGANGSGYCGKIKTEYMLQLYHENVWRRVYATCWANASSFWIMYRGAKVSINSTDLMDIK